MFQLITDSVLPHAIANFYSKVKLLGLDIEVIEIMGQLAAYKLIKD